MTDPITKNGITLPRKREEADTLEETLTANAYQNILPARYLKKNADGEPVEEREDLFPRVAKNIALAEAVYEADKQGESITVTPDQLKPEHPRRDELAEQVFGMGTGVDSDAEATLSVYNVSKFAYDTVVPELPDEIRVHVKDVRASFQDDMESLSFMPNSPTIMNAGDELQQLSACFVDSPKDDITDIHDTATEAAEIFQSGGGMGYSFSRLRPYGDPVGSTGGIASGPITFMRTYDQLCETIAQGGARRGAQMGIMNISHPDVIQFIHAKNKDVSLAQTLRLNDPDDFTHNSFADALEEARELIDEEGKVPKHLRNAVEGHLSNFNISVGVTDAFMEAMKNDDEFVFTNPRSGEPHVATPETKELYDMFGLGEHVEVGEVLSVPASEIWSDMVEGAHENGEPGVIYMDRVNEKHSFDSEVHPEHEILATNPCLSGDTKVRLADGTTERIDSLVDRESFEVLSKAEMVDAKTATAFQTKSDAEVLEITTEDGVNITATPDHEFNTRDSGWIEAGELSPGDGLVAISRPLATPHGTDVENTTCTVESIVDAPSEDVYDLTVEDTHNFFAAADDGTMLNVHNCGEQPLEEYEACNLGHINLSTLAALDAPDWRAWNAEHGDDYDDLEAAMAAFLEHAIEWDEFNDRIATGTRFLENVVTMSDFPVKKIEEKVRDMRKIGLGIMGLAQLYIQVGVKYGSEESNVMARQLMTHINHESKKTSHKLAEERGVFNDWDESKYANPTEYCEWFEHHTGEDADDWEDGYPIRNHNTTTIAPTGTTSMIGNTTGGCEPIYNVAYYKNVSGDVQGDEMLVEFDDYFLRTLVENDIDVDAVKAEAEEQMEANEFNGVEGLETVPTELGELFVVTSDLSGIEHASIQCALQDGVDSSISKTCNFPNSATEEDMDEVYRYIYDNGGKGVTVYRDGTRSKQVLTTRAQNAEFSDQDEAAEVLVDQIVDAFGSLDEFLDHDDVADVFKDELEGVVDTAEALNGAQGPVTEDDFIQPREREKALPGVTQRIDTGYGKLYVNINEDSEGRPFEVIANIGNSGGFTSSFTEALAKVISSALRSGVDPEEIQGQLSGIRSPKVDWDSGTQISSIPDAIGTAMRRHLDDEVDKDYPDQTTIDEATKNTPKKEEAVKTNGGVDTADTNTSPVDSDPNRNAEVNMEEDQQAMLEEGETPECPECGDMRLYYSEGCKTCESCGWSEC